MTDAGDGGPAVQALLDTPKGAVADATGALYIADSANHKIRKVSPDGVISTFAGTGVSGWSGDGGPAINAMLGRPMNPAVGQDGSIYFADPFNSNVRRVAPDGTISTIAGNGSDTDDGDGGPATGASLNLPTAVAVDLAGNVYVANNPRVRRIDGATGIITTYFGPGADPYNTDCCVTGIAVDSNSNLYIANGGLAISSRSPPMEARILSPIMLAPILSPLTVTAVSTSRNLTLTIRINPEFGRSVPAACLRAFCREAFLRRRLATRQPGCSFPCLHP